MSTDDLGADVEAQLTIVGAPDGWRIRLQFTDGFIVLQPQPPFKTRPRAQRALQRWIDNNQLGRKLGH